MTINLRKITQGERGTLTFTWEFPENLTSPASISGANITATMTDEDSVTTTVSGTLTGTAATTCTWALSAGDSGTAGTFTVLFAAVVTGVTTYTLEATLEIIANPAATGTQNDPLVSISAADAAWVTLAATAVPDGADVVDANDLGTAAYAATGDFDAAGAAAAAQAASLQKASNLSDVANATTARTNIGAETEGTAAELAGKTVVVMGDSLAAALYTRLSAAIVAARPSYTVINAAIGGENTAQVARRYQGAQLAYPIAGTDSPAAGAVNLLARQPDVPSLRDNANQANWTNLRARIAPVGAVRFYDRGVYLGSARQQVFMARRNAGYLVLYGPNSLNAAPGGTNTNAGNETAVMTTSAMINATIAQSEDYADAGRYSAKVTASATGNFAIQIAGFNGGFPSEMEADVYIPVGSSITSVGFYNATAIELGTDSQKSTSVKGSWQRVQWTWVPGGADVATVNLGYSGGADMTGATFYVENMRTLRGYLGTASTVILDTQRVYVKPIGTGALPSPLKADRTYYVKTTGVTGTIEISETSGGAAIALSTAGACYIYGDWVLPVTFSAEQAAAYRISAVPASTWHKQKTVVWTGHNPDEANTDINYLLGMDALDTSKMLILQATPSDAQIRGTSAWNNQEWTTANLEAEFPGRVVYARDELIAAGSGTGQDLLDAGNGICPVSLRSDSIHINDAGAIVVTASVMEKFNNAGF